MIRFAHLLGFGAIALLGFGGASHAATTVGTATPGQGNCIPFGCNAAGSSDTTDVDYYQVYSAAAFTGTQSFDTITFRDSGLNYSQFFTAPPSPDLIAGAYNISFSTTSAPLGSAFPIGSLQNTQTFYLGGLQDGSQYSGFSLSGNTYTYDPSQGNLVMHVIASNQAVTPNNGDVGFLAEDTSGGSLSRAYDETGTGVHADGDGLVTTFSLGPVTAAPEPTAWALMIMGMGLVGGALRRKTAMHFA